MVELRERRARVCLVRVRHRRVLAEDIHGPDIAGVNCVDDLDDGETPLRVQLRSPEVLVPLAVAVILH